MIFNYGSGRHFKCSHVGVKTNVAESRIIWPNLSGNFSFCTQIMLILRVLKKNRPTRDVPVIHLIFCVILVCLLIYTWKLFGCVGYPESYLCKTFTPDCFLHPNSGNSSTDDFSKLMDLSNFTFLMNNYACNKSDLLLLVLVHSDPNNYEKRSTIRNTWGKTNGDDFKLLFLLGIPNSTDLQNRLEVENDANGDLVQGNFVDTYRNLTYKHVMALKWTKYYCPQAKYLLKTDDDVFVNSPSFLRYLNERLPDKKLMRCLPVYEGRAQRTSRSKWRVTWSEYKFRRYPPFCQGFAILYSPDVVLTLYAKAQTADYFWIDDVFITGFLAMSANFTPTTFGKFMLEPHDLRRLMTGPESDVFPYLLGPWNLAVADIKKLWEMAFRAGYVRTIDS